MFKAVMNCVTNALKASIWDPNNVRVMLSACISGPFGTLKLFLITVVIDLAKASLASRSDVFSSLRDDVRRMTDSCSTDVEGISTVGAAATTQQRFCLWGRDRQQRFWRGQDSLHYRDLLFNCWPWFFDDLIAESKTKKILKKKKQRHI